MTKWLTTRSQVLAWALAGLLLLALAAAGTRMYMVHEQTWDWRLWPREVPERVQFGGRDFNCGEHSKPQLTADEGLLTGMSVYGKTAGGAEIFSLSAEPGIHIGVKATDGTHLCALMGGL